MSKLTIDRGSYTAQYLNGLWDSTRDKLWSVLPSELSYVEGKSFHDLEISESDPEAQEIIDAETLVLALITKVNRLADNYISVTVQDNQVDVSVFDKIGEHGGRVGTLIPNYSEIVNTGFTNPNVTNNFWVNTIFENQYQMVHQTNLVDLKDFMLTTSYTTVPSYNPNSSSNNVAMNTFFNTSSLANSIATGGNQLLIGNEDSDWIDINLNNSSSSQYLANAKISKDRTPFKTLSIQNPTSVAQNSFIRTETGIEVPTSLLPKTTLTKALDLVVRSTQLTEQNIPFDFKAHATLTFSLDTETVTSYKKVINNQSGQGWFSDGYLGSEQFDGLGFDEWGIGKSKLLTTMNLGIEIDSPESFANGYEDWFVGDASELSEELNWFEFPEGITPTKPSCSSDSSSNGVTDNLTSQINGTNQVFTTNQSYESGTLKVYWNGQRQHDATITELTSTTFRTSFIPISGNTIVVDYIPF